ncbi:ATP phosphoribosyltransferase regulatory subunit [Alphaproteobacteria bacterium]|nr:ATP phosphoribosyltransferase regulatory subunit [Alphaproteobacteria bacterium]
MEYDKSKALLPSGFEDQLPDMAEREAATVGALMENFACFGYRRIKPPLLEFEESLFASGPGEVLQDRSFRVMDPISHRMMGLRPDITAQIARISSSRLANEERPLRLMYANDSFRTKAGQNRSVRQFCQVGFEILGADSLEADIEVCVVSLKALYDLGVRDLTLDLAIPGLVDFVLDHHKVSKADKDKLREILNVRNVSALRSYDKKIAQALYVLMGLTGEAEEVLKVLSKIDLPKEAKRLVLDVRRVLEGVQAALVDLGLDDIQITIDPVEYRGFSYHTGVSMSVFVAGAVQEVGRGGRYNICDPVTGQLETATGFSFYMDLLRDFAEFSENSKTVFVDEAVKWSDIKALQKEGWVVTRGLGQNEDSDPSKYVYENGKVVER